MHVSEKRKLFNQSDCVSPTDVSADVETWSTPEWISPTYEFVVGSAPFEGKDTVQTYKRIRNERPDFPEFLSNDCVDLISRMLCKRPTERITLDEVAQHPFLQQALADGGKFCKERYGGMVGTMACQEEAKLQQEKQRLTEKERAAAEKGR